MKKVLKWVGISLLAITVLGIVAVASDDTTSNEKTGNTSAPSQIIYDVVKEDESTDGLYLRIAVNDRYEKKDLIEILRKSKEQYKWKDKLVAWFYIKKFSESGAWASAAYLPECDNCETDKDSDGTSVQYHLLGITKAKADSLRQLTLDTISNKKLVASYIEDISQCKTEIYEVDGNSKRLLIAKLFAPGDHLLDWVNLKVVNGEDRYYFEDETDGEGNYMVNEWGIKTVHFRNKEGKEWQTFSSE